MKLVNHALSRRLLLQKFIEICTFTNADSSVTDSAERCKDVYSTLYSTAVFHNWHLIPIQSLMLFIGKVMTSSTTLAQSKVAA